MLEKIKTFLIAISGLLIAAFYAIIKHKESKIESLQKEITTKVIEKETGVLDEKVKNAKETYIDSRNDYDAYNELLNSPDKNSTTE
jgi:predicted nuclease with TOPRIM domain